ncbi:phosphate/phosphite/phosphonate ABC transporter substrate-binding protein, partial [Tahibacter caeni]|uniref:phosphate/phosphite/phosphonate ABC transporter substrate-binding protein n=1 Tax=Tahibacter caeni TaxID=1453545 RepID=UPI002147378D
MADLSRRRPESVNSCLRFLACMLLAAVALAPAQAEPAAVLATYAYARYDRAAALQPLADHLQRRLGRAVEVRVLESPRALAAALREGTVDLAVTNTFVYLGVRDQSAIHATAVFEVPPATLDAYRGVLLARRDGPAASVEAMQAAAARLRYAQVIPGSTSGGLVQDLFLASRGLKPAQFAAVRQAGTHEAALAAVADGSADVAALADAPWQARRRDGRA